MHGEKNDIRPALKAKIIDESTIIYIIQISQSLVII